jgi:hypothetical protein
MTGARCALGERARGSVCSGAWDNLLVYICWTSKNRKRVSPTEAVRR